jgi:hypothetical protein
MRDPGLQPERTALAWGRTALTAFINAGLLIKAGLDSARASVVLCGGVLLLGACTLQLIALMRRRRLTQGVGLRSVSAYWMLSAVALVWISLWGCLVAIAGRYCE